MEILGYLQDLEYEWLEYEIAMYEMNHEPSLSLAEEWLIDDPLAYEQLNHEPLFHSYEPYQPYPGCYDDWE